jgi:hypothetical protein
MPAMATLRPPRKGPINRQRMSWYNFGSTCADARVAMPKMNARVLGTTRRIEITVPSWKQVRIN